MSAPDDFLSQIDDLLNELALLPSEREVGAQRTRIYSKLRALRMKVARLRGRHTEVEWLALQERHKYRCAACGVHRPLGLTKDHVVSIYQGGSDAIDNLRPVCQPCNSRKGHR